MDGCVNVTAGAEAEAVGEVAARMKVLLVVVVQVVVVQEVVQAREKRQGQAGGAA